MAEQAGNGLQRVGVGREKGWGLLRVEEVGRPRANSWKQGCVPPITSEAPCGSSGAS